MQQKIKEAIKAKANELEVAIAFNKPYAELLTLYKELKELQFRKLQIELAVETSKDLNPS